MFHNFLQTLSFARQKMSRCRALTEDKESKNLMCGFEGFKSLNALSTCAALNFSLPLTLARPCSLTNQSWNKIIELLEHRLETVTDYAIASKNHRQSVKPVLVFGPVRPALLADGLILHWIPVRGLRAEVICGT